MSPANTSDTLISLDPLLLTFVVGAVIPVVTAFATKLVATNAFRVLISLFLSAVSGAMIQVNNSGGTFYLKQTVVAAAVTFATSIVTYQGWWKPVTQINENAAPNIGLVGLKTTDEQPPAAQET